MRQRDTLALVANASLIAFTAWKVNTAVPEPYMDEIFHVKQAQAYCQGHWTEWDPKLTTPPGLYLLPAAVQHTLQFLGVYACDTKTLRAYNAILGALLPLLLADLINLIRHGPDRATPDAAATHRANRPRLARSALGEALSISQFPLVFFFCFLYYTDVASLFAVLLSYRQALKQKYIASASIGLISLLFRQTNILWIAFIAFTALDVKLREISNGRGRQVSDLQRLDDPKESGFHRLPQAAWTFAFTALSNPIITLAVLLPYGPVAFAFVAFIRWNGGIVLGDKSMHVAAVHIPQLYYFSAFAAAMALPIMLDLSTTSQRGPRRKATTRRTLMNLGISALMGATIRQFTIVHPFLLADNRHYPFYIWRKILNVHPLARYAAVPGYTTATSLLYSAIARARVWTVLPLSAFIAVTAATLIPSPLLEFRYFIVPFVILRLHLRPTARWQIVMESVVYCSVNLATLWLFLYRPFKWPSEPGWQRFMW